MVKKKNFSKISGVKARKPHKTCTTIKLSLLQKKSVETLRNHTICTQAFDQILSADSILVIKFLVLHSILDQQKAIFKCVVDTPDVVVPSTAANCNDAPAQNLKVRSFQTRRIANTTTNLILGSSIIARVNQNELPLDVEIIPYSGSTTDEKMTILQKTNFAQLKTIIIQDGTNSIL